MNVYASSTVTHLKLNTYSILVTSYIRGIPRIEYRKHAYTVVRKPAFKTNHTVAIVSLSQIRGDISDYNALVHMVANYDFESSVDFLRFVATKDYFRTKLLDNLSQINSNDKTIQNEQASILRHVAGLDRLVPQADDYERILGLSKKTFGGLYRRPPNRLFLILPTNLDHWDETNTAIHTFRLYFLCNNSCTSNWRPHSKPEHVHFPSHPGYDLKRPQEFLQQHGDHALAVLLTIKYGFRGEKYHVPSLDSFDVLATAKKAIPRHELTEDNAGPRIDKAIAYIRDFLQKNQSSVWDGSLWDIKSFLQIDEHDNGTGDLFMKQQSQDFENQWICKEHFPLHPRIEELRLFVHSQGGTIDLHNNTAKITLTSKPKASLLARHHKRTAQYFELFVHIAWKASRSEFREVCDQFVESGFLLIHVRGISSRISSQDPLEFTCKSDCLIILYDYPRPAESYISLVLRQRARNGHLGLLVRQHVTVSDILWDELVPILFDAVRTARRGNAASLLDGLKENLSQHAALDIFGFNVFHPKSNLWQGLFEVKEGLRYGLVEVAIPNDQFHTSVMESGLLRQLVLQSCSTHDMLKVVSLMACSPLLERIKFPAQEGSIFSRIATIRKNYHHNTRPLELTFSDQRETTLARLTIGHGASSQAIDFGFPEPITPSVDIHEWQIDRVHESMQDSGVQVLDDASQLFPSILTSFTLDITALTIQGLVNVCNVLQRSALECLHIRCVPFIPFLGASIGQVLQAIQWPTIKSLVLTGNNIDDWLQLWGSGGSLHDLVGTWADPSASGPSLLSLSIITHEQNKPILSHASALVIRQLVYSCALVEICFENILFKTHRDWDLVLGGIQYSSLQNMSVQGSNISDTQRNMAMMGRPLLRFKDRVGGWLRKKI